jgi:hypothetical protein
MFIENMDANLCDPEGVVSNTFNYSSINISLHRSEKQDFEGFAY